LGSDSVAEITDPTFMTFGKDLRAWKFLVHDRFDSKRQEINTMTTA